MLEINIDADRISLNGVIADQYAHWSALGKTRAPHPDERLRYIPEHLRERERDAKTKLFSGLMIEAAPVIRRAQRSRHIPDQKEARALLDDLLAKSRNYEMLRDLGTEFVLASEIAGANAEAEVAWHLYQTALKKNAATSCVDCRRPQRRRALTDGYVKTGRHKMIHGVRVPVVRSVS